MDSYEIAKQQFEAGYNDVMSSGISKEAAAEQLAKIMAGMSQGVHHKAKADQPAINGRAAAYREIIAA